jgi:hypothetical protein
VFFNRSKKSIKINLGVLEAEAETMLTSTVKLSDVFFDDLGIIDKLSSQRFIVVGRKGAGKSALANYINISMNDIPTSTCKIIKHDAIERELNIQGFNSDAVLGLDFYKWLVMVNLIDLLINHETLFEDIKAFERLKEFLEVNRGGVKITDKKVTSVETNNSNSNESSFGVDAKPLKMFMKVNGMSSVKNIKNSPSIYEILPDLEKVIDKLLQYASQSGNDNSYSLIFDDLDIGFKSNKEESIDNLICLLRATKDINAKWSNFNFKCIILLRDDVERLLISKESDLNKLFGSYSTELNWHTQGDEAPELKSFIERRIKNAFNECHKIENANWINLTTCLFKDVLDKTFCRPRDLIAYFSPLSEKEYNYPLTKSETDKLSIKYSSHVKDEFCNELSSFYTESEIDSILRALSIVQKDQPTVGEITPHLISANLDPVKILKDLYDRSFIGMRNDKGHVFFKYKFLSHHNFGEELKTNNDQKIIVHYIFEQLFKDIY